MQDNSSNRVDEDLARAHFENVLSGHEQAFETFVFARFLGLSFEYLPHDAADEKKEICRLQFNVTDLLKNPQGVLHGGAICSAMDISMGHLVNKVAGAGATIEMKVQFMRPMTGGIATVEGRFTKRGRRLSFMESRLMTADGTLVALASATWKMPET